MTNTSGLDVRLEESYRAATTAVAVTDVSGRGKLEIAGPDAPKFVSNLCTNNVLGLAAGQGAEAFFLDAKGRVVEYCVAYRLEQSIWLDIDTGRAGQFARHLDKYHIRENLTIVDRTAELRQIHLVGPNAGAVVAEVAAGQFAAQNNLCASWVVIADHRCQIRRCDRSLITAYDLLCGVGDFEEVRTAVQKAAASFGSVNCDDQVLETLRIEAGIPAAGKDISDDGLPQELGRNAQAISLTKGCYLGQETVARIESYGHVNRRLIGLVFERSALMPPGVALKQHEKVVGRLGSSAYSPAFGRTVGLAVVRAETATPGTPLLAELDDGTVSATVHALPMIAT